MDIKQNLNSQKKVYSNARLKGARGEIDSKVLLGTRPILNGLRLTMPDIFEIEDRAMLSILDVGCGTGADTTLLLHMGGYINTMGIDLSESRIACGRRTMEKLFLKADCLKAMTIQDVMKTNKTYDIVIGQSVVHHFPQYGSLISSFYSVLKKQGRCLFYDPSFFPKGIFNGHYNWKNGEFYQKSGCEEIYIIPFKIKRALLKAGFKNIRIFSNFYISKVTRIMSKIPILRVVGPSLYIYAEKTG